MKRITDSEGIIGVNVPTHYDRHVAQQAGLERAPENLPAMDPEAALREQDAEAGKDRAHTLAQAQAVEREKAEGAAHEEAARDAGGDKPTEAV